MSDEGNGKGEHIEEALAIIEAFPELATQFLEKAGIEYEDGDVKKLDTLSQGILSGRYDYAGFGIFQTSTLERLLAGGKLSARGLREIARQCSIIDYCVGTICREIPSTPWDIKPVDRNRKAPRNKVRAIKEFFQSPIKLESDYTFHQFMAKNLRDLMILDWNLIERVRSKTGKLAELWPLDSGRYAIKVDNSGRTKYYYVDDMFYSDTSAEQKKEKRIYPEDIICKMIYPRTGTPYGKPIIESILEEIGTIVFSTISIRKEFTDGEIPHGVLNVGPMSKANRERMKSELMQEKGSSWALRILYGVAALQWVQFKRTNVESQRSELHQHFERIIYRLFGFNQIDVADTGSLSKASAREQKNVGRTRLFLPLLNLYKRSFDWIIHHEFNAPDLEFVWNPLRIEDMESVSRFLERAVFTGAMSPNDVAMWMGNDPVPGGEERVIKNGNQLMLVSDLPKLKLSEERNGADQPDNETDAFETYEEDTEKEKEGR